MKDVWMAFAWAPLVMGLAVPSTPATAADEFVVREVGNPAFHNSEIFRAFEVYYSPRVTALRERYGLEEVVAGETDELKRILLLRHWIKSQIRIEDRHPTQTRGDAFAILDAAQKGGGFHCAHFSIVQHAVLNSFGYVTRRLGCGPGLEETKESGHHGVNEVWVNTLAKWMIVDAKYDIHFEKDGVPLSALEIRDEVWKDGATSVVVSVGPERKTARLEPSGPWERRADTYRWCSWETDSNRFTAFPASSTSTIVMLEDDIFRNNTWFRDGRPMWAYDTPYLITTRSRGWIEWTPNVIASTVTIDDGHADIFLESVTPNFETFQMKSGDGEWVDCDERVKPTLERKLNRFRFRTLNLFGVAGPEHGVEIEWQGVD